MLESPRRGRRCESGLRDCSSNTRGRNHLDRYVQQPGRLIDLRYSLYIFTHGFLAPLHSLKALTKCLLISLDPYRRAELKCVKRFCGSMEKDNFEWGDEQRASFEHVKKPPSKNSISEVNGDLLLYLSIDVSKYEFREVLSQLPGEPSGPECLRQT